MDRRYGTGLKGVYSALVSRNCVPYQALVYKNLVYKKINLRHEPLARRAGVPQ